MPNYTTELDLLKAVTSGDGNSDTLKVDNSGSSIPTGAATSAKQDTGNTSLASIDTKLSSQATASKQDTGNSSLSTIAGKDFATQTTLSLLKTKFDDVFQQNVVTGPGTTNVDFDCTGICTLKIQIDHSNGADSFQVFGSVDGVAFGDAFAPNTYVFDELFWQPVQQLEAGVNGAVYNANVSGLKTFRVVAIKAGATTSTISFRGNNTGPGVLGITGLVIAQQNSDYTVTDANLELSQASTTSGQKGPLIQGATTTAAPSYTTAKTNPLSLDTAGNLRVSLGGTAANSNKLLVTADAVTFASPQHVINDASSAVIGHVIADSGSTTAVTGNVTVIQGTGTNLHVVVDTAPSTAVTNTGTFAVQAAATLAAETTKVIGTVNVAASQTIAVTNAGTFATQATLAAETTKVIGTVNQGTSPWVGSTVLTTGSAQIGHLEANQSVNNAQVAGSTTVASVTGVQDVMPRKRTGATGLSPNYSASHITAKTTTTPASATAYVSCIAISCSAAGTAWTMIIRDKQATPLILVPSFTLTVPTTGLPVILQFAEPIIMTRRIYYLLAIMFRNVVEMQDSCEVITNPENRLVVANQITQFGRKFITWSTIMNWILINVLSKVGGFFKRGKVKHSANNDNRRLPPRV